MPQDKYNAVWVSHSSMGDFLKCKRAYFLHNIYKDPKTGRKVNIVNPHLSLGQAVHTTLEDLKNIPLEERLTKDLLADFEKAWEKVSGKIGGFKDEAEEKEMKERGRSMIERVKNNLGPISRKTVRLKMSDGGMLPNFYLDESENIILCGLIDWLEYEPLDDSIKILDFKTGKYEEDGESLQLPIYLLLLDALQKRQVSGAAYWYLDRDNEPIEVKLPDIAESREKVLKVAKAVKEAREKKDFTCASGINGCFACKPFEKILKGEAEYVGVGGYGQDMYIV